MEKKIIIFIVSVILILIVSVILFKSVISYADNAVFQCSHTFTLLYAFGDEQLDLGIWQENKDYNLVEENLVKLNGWVETCEYIVDDSLLLRPIWDLFAKQSDLNKLSSLSRKKLDTYNLILIDFKKVSELINNEDFENAENYKQEAKSKYYTMLTSEK